MTYYSRCVYMRAYTIKDATGTIVIYESISVTRNVSCRKEDPKCVSIRRSDQIWKFV